MVARGLEINPEEIKAREVNMKGKKGFEEAINEVIYQYYCNRNESKTQYEEDKKNEKCISQATQDILKAVEEDSKIPEILQSDIRVLELMIEHYEKRGGGYSQKEALKTAIKIMKKKPVELDEGKILKLIESVFLHYATDSFMAEKMRNASKWLAHAIVQGDVWKRGEER